MENFNNFYDNACIKSLKIEFDYMVGSKREGFENHVSTHKI